MKLIYIYHSCYVLEFDEFSLIIDYYKDSGVSPLKGYVHDVLLLSTKPLYVLSSHYHPDHFNVDILSWKKQKKDIIYILSEDILQHNKACAGDGFYIKKGESFHDQNLIIKAFGSTDVGVSFLIKTKDLNLFHAGDLNNWHWMEESTPDEIAEAESFYLQELDYLAGHVKHVNLAMFPIDPRLGKEYMKGAQQFVEKIKVEKLAPMHFGEAYDKVAEFANYAILNHCSLLDVVRKGQSFEL